MNNSKKARQTVIEAGGFSTLTPLENSILMGAPRSRKPCSSCRAATESSSRRKLTKPKLRPGSRAMPSTSPHRRNNSDRSDAVTPGPRLPTQRCRDGGATPHPEERRGGGSSRAEKRSEPSPLAPPNLPRPTPPRPRPLPICKNRSRFVRANRISINNSIYETGVRGRTRGRAPFALWLRRSAGGDWKVRVSRFLFGEMDEAAGGVFSVSLSLWCATFARSPDFPRVIIAFLGWKMGK